MLDKVAEFGKREDVVESRLHVLVVETHQSAIKDRVLPAGELGVEGSSKLENGGDHPIDLDIPRGRNRGPGDDLQER